MYNYLRSREPGATFFFTVNTYRRQPLLIRDEVRAALKTAIHQVRAEHPFQTDAWVLMPDHLHAIWTLPEGDATMVCAGLPSNVM